MWFVVGLDFKSPIPSQSVPPPLCPLFELHDNYCIGTTTCLHPYLTHLLSQTGRPNRARVANSNQQARSFNRENQENRNNRSPRTFNNSYEPTNDDLHDGKDTRWVFNYYYLLLMDFFLGRTERTASNRGQRGPRRGNGPPLRYRNMNNRHSGSDKSSVKPTEKREGGGAHNWGKSVDEFSATAEEEEVVNGDKPAEDTEKTGTEQDGGDAQENVEPKNDEPQFKTLDEYKREREEKRMHTQFNTRKPGEGEDKSKWKKTYVLKKKPEPEEEEVEYEEIEVVRVLPFVIVETSAN